MKAPYSNYDIRNCNMKTADRTKIPKDLTDRLNKELVLTALYGIGVIKAGQNIKYGSITTHRSFF